MVMGQEWGPRRMKHERIFCQWSASLCVSHPLYAIPNVVGLLPNLNNCPALLGLGQKHYKASYLLLLPVCCDDLSRPWPKMSGLQSQSFPVGRRGDAHHPAFTSLPARGSLVGMDIASGHPDTGLCQWQSPWSSPYYTQQERKEDSALNSVA